jgi:O-glycosyl hydrolase
VWPKEISQFSARNLKHHLGSELGALEVEFGLLPMGKPDYDWVWWYAKFDSTQFQKKYLNPSSYAIVMTVLPKHVRVMILEGRIWLGIEIG